MGNSPAYFAGSLAVLMICGEDTVSQYSVMLPQLISEDGPRCHVAGVFLVEI